LGGGGGFGGKLLRGLRRKLKNRGHRRVMEKRATDESDGHG